jgi:uncharacterized protein (TIGR00661 family)
VLVGTNNDREIPKFFYEKIGVGVEKFSSPNFCFDKNNRRVQIIKSILYNISHLRRFIKSLIFINNTIKETNPDIIVNFYDPLPGLARVFKKHHSKLICIGHQYFFFLKEAPLPPNNYLSRQAFLFYSRLTALKADKILALSFRPIKSIFQKNNYFVVPPLLRKEIHQLPNTNNNFLLVYLLNPGYAPEIIAWHKKHSQQKLEVFWDNKEAEEVFVQDKNLIFYRLHDKLFLEKLSSCTAYVSSAGFESICEALYLKKPTLLVPTEGHFEQLCNAYDAVAAGAGIWNKKYVIDELINYLKNHKANNDFTDWIKQAPDLIIPLLK